MCRVGQNRVYTPYMTVCMMISLPKIPYIHRKYLKMYVSGQPYACLPASRARTSVTAALRFNALKPACMACCWVVHTTTTHTHTHTHTQTKAPLFHFSRTHLTLCVSTLPSPFQLFLIASRMPVFVILVIRTSIRVHTLHVRLYMYVGLARTVHIRHI